MSIENARIECPAKPITHAFIHFKNDAERNKHIRSANMLKKDLRGKKVKITRSMDAEERFHQKRMVYIKYCIHVRHNIPLDLISMNWTLKHVSVKGQVVVKTCQSGSLKYIKDQDIETEVECQMEKWQSKKLIATTVSNRETGQRRRDEGKTTSSQMHTATQENQGSNKGTRQGKAQKKVGGDFPPCMRRAKDNNDNNTRKNENLKGKGGGRLKHYNVDGDVPLCNKMKDESKSKMVSGSKDMCGDYLLRRNTVKVRKTKNKDVTFIVLQKT